MQSQNPSGLHDYFKKMNSKLGATAAARQSNGAGMMTQDPRRNSNHGQRGSSHAARGTKGRNITTTTEVLLKAREKVHNNSNKRAKARQAVGNSSFRAPIEQNLSPARLDNDHNSAQDLGYV